MPVITVKDKPHVKAVIGYIPGGYESRIMIRDTWYPATVPYWRLFPDLTRKSRNLERLESMAHAQILSIN